MRRASFLLLLCACGCSTLSTFGDGRVVGAGKVQLGAQGGMLSSPALRPQLVAGGDAAVRVGVGEHVDVGLRGGTSGAFAEVRAGGDLGERLHLLGAVRGGVVGRCEQDVCPILRPSGSVGVAASYDVTSWFRPLLGVQGHFTTFDRFLVVAPGLDLGLGFLVGRWSFVPEVNAAYWPWFNVVSFGATFSVLVRVG